MRVVADTSPLNYLALIGSVAILPAMFATVLIPIGVERELTDAFAPDEVRRLMRSAPPWLTVQPCPADPDASLAHLDDGEREAVLLARALDVDLRACLTLTCGDCVVVVSGGNDVDCRES